MVVNLFKKACFVNYYKVGRDLSGHLQIYSVSKTEKNIDCRCYVLE